MPRRSARGCATGELEPSWLRVLEEDGRVVGYGDIWPQVGRSLARRRSARPLGCVLRLGGGGGARGAGFRRVRVQVPHGHRARRDRRCARGYEALAALADDGDRSSTRSRPPSAFRRGLILRTYTDGDTAALIAALNEAFADDPFWHDVSPRELPASSISAHAASIASSGCSPGTATSSRALRSTIPSTGATLQLGWVEHSRRPPRLAPPRPRRGAAPAPSFRRALRRAGLRRVGLGVDAENVDRCAAALRARRHARRCAVRTTGQKACERAPREVPRLPHADRRRDRARVPVPLVRPRVRGRARARAARVRRRRRGDGRGGRARTAVARGRRRSTSRRSTSRSRRRRASCRSARSCSAAAAAPTSAPSASSRGATAASASSGSTRTAT